MSSSSLDSQFENSTKSNDAIAMDAILSQMLSSNDPAPTRQMYETMVVTCAYTQNWILYIKWWSFMKASKEFQPTVHTYNRLLTVFARTYYRRGMEELLLEMGKAGIKPTCSTYALLMNAYGSKGEFDILFNLWEDMINHGIQPDDKTYRQAIDAIKHNSAVLKQFLTHIQKPNLRELHQHDTLIRIFLEAEDTGIVGELWDQSQKEGFQLAVDTYVLLVRLFGRNRDINSMKKILKMFIENKILPKPFLFRAVMNAFATMGDVAVVDWLWEHRAKFNIEPTAMDFTVLVNMYGKLGNLSMVKQTWKQFEDQGVSLNETAFQALLSMFSKQTNSEGIHAVVQAMKKIGIQPSGVLHPLLGPDNLESMENSNK